MMCECIYEMESAMTNQEEKKQFYRTAFALVIPMAVQNLINVAVQSADVIMLGKLNEEALTASSLAGQIQFVMMLLIFGLSSGTSVLTAQYWGKEDRDTIGKILGMAIRISMAIALIFFLAAELFPEFLMRIFSPDDHIVALGAEYLRFVAPNYLFVGFTSLYLGIMRSVERVKIATIVFLISLCVNIILNAVFIFGLLGFPAMHLKGAALATSLSRLIEFLIVAVYAKRNTVISLKKKYFISFDKLLFKDFLHCAGPTTINELLWGSAIAMNAVIIGHMGISAVSANSVAQVTRQLANVVSFGIANATAVLLGKAIGAGKVETAKLIASRMIRTGMICSLAGGSLILILRPLISMLMNLKSEANDYLLFLLLVMSVYVMAQTYSAILIVGVCRGGGDTKFGMYLDLFVMWVCCILPASLGAFVFHLPVKIIYLIMMADEFIKIPFCLIRYKKKLWLQNLTR